LVDSRKIATATLLGVLIAAVKAPFPFPVSDFLNIVEVPLLGLSFILLGRGGATYAGLVNGMLSSLAKVGYFPYNLIFGVSYGILVDAFCIGFRARAGEGANSRRLMASLAAASTVLGVLITYVTLTFNVNPSVSFPSFTDAELLELVYLPTVIWGVFSGVVGGFVAARVWDRGLGARFGHVKGAPGRTG
jgi:hypothetical protein